MQKTRASGFESGVTKGGRLLFKELQTKMVAWTIKIRGAVIMPPLKKRSFWSCIYLRFFLRFLPARALYYLNKIAPVFILIRSAKFISFEKDMTLRALATYFHLGIHAHVFVRINQSLLGSQVNYILMLNGYVPVHHGHADLAAAFLSTYHFCNYFERYVLSNGNLNPNGV